MSLNDLGWAQLYRFTGIPDNRGVADILGGPGMNAAGMDEMLQSANTLSATRKPKRPINAKLQHYELVSRYAAAVEDKKAGFSLEAAIQAYASADAGKDTPGLVKAKSQVASMDKTLAALDAVSAAGRDFYQKRDEARAAAGTKLAELADAAVAGKKVKQEDLDSARWAATTATEARAQIKLHVPVKASPPARK